VKLDLMMLTNYAEVAPNGLLYIAGGGWDTITVQGPIEGAPEGVFAAMQGALAIKLLFHMTETERRHAFEVTIMDNDGAEIAKSAGEFDVPKNDDLPPQWLQNLNIVLPVTGIALPREGHYVVNLTVNGQWLGDAPFRVIKHYED
jgi:hypothetical protein